MHIIFQKGVDNFKVDLQHKIFVKGIVPFTTSKWKIKLHCKIRLQNNAEWWLCFREISVNGKVNFIGLPINLQ